MIVPPVPPDEEQRLETLRSLEILDTPAEARFDRLTRMAKRMFDVPISLVSLVDADRQWFKSCIGLPVRETPRDLAFCGHAILGDGIFYVEDATKDERFADNPLVAGDPHIRFYAGAPLKAADGSKLGTLCVIDHEARHLTAEDAAVLTDLAGMVESELAAISLATTDELTGIPNRRGLMMLLGNSLSICKRMDLPATLLYFDLNDFKSINDTLGHAEGDNALKAFADNLTASCRSTDIPARLGGDEFVALLVGATKSDADKVINKLRDNLESHNQSLQGRYKLCFSAGVLEFDEHRHADVAAFLTEADSCMYETKNRRAS